MDNSIPRHWRLKAQRYQMVGQPCSKCQQVSFPPRPICNACATEEPQLFSLNLDMVDQTHNLEVALEPV